jgi:hypothetical protein
MNDHGVPGVSIGREPPGSREAMADHHGEALRGTDAAAAADAIRHVTREGLDGFFIHLDADCLDDEIMPAVDYRIPGGLSWDELAVAEPMDFTLRNVLPRLEKAGDRWHDALASKQSLARAFGSISRTSS